MARKKIREYDAKKFLTEQLPSLNKPYRGILVDEQTNLETLPQAFPWLLDEKSVIKPDMLFGKRKKLNLVRLNTDFAGVKSFITELRSKEMALGNATGSLTHFLIEPFIPHEKEYYLAITAEREQDVIFFSERGGVAIEENWNTITKIELPLQIKEETSLLIPKLSSLPEHLRFFITEVYALFKKSHFCYLECNPFTIDDAGNITILDTVAQVDSCGMHLLFPPAFGKRWYSEEEHIQALDKTSSASLKLTILNPRGRIWNILSGGGASIIFLDAIAQHGKQQEIANYGEYSGNPTPEETYQYTKTILQLMTKEPHPQGKVLIIGGAIANFTDVEKTFTGIIRALRECQQPLQQGKISIFVRRGGPNAEKGLRLMEETGKELNLPMLVHGAEHPMTAIVEKALEALV